MGDENGREQPSLELPKLGLRRRKRKPTADAAPAGGEQATGPEAATVADPPLTEQAPEPEAPPASGEQATVSMPVAVADAPLPGEPAPEAEEPSRRRERRPIRVRPQRPGGMLAAVVVGLVVGLGIVGLTWASLQGCEQVQGTTSCGRTGYVLLIAILVVMVIVGSLLLRLARVPESASTSFLAVGLASVIALLLLVDHLTDRSMVVVIPLLGAVCYAAAHWVTRTFVDAA